MRISNSVRNAFLGVCILLGGALVTANLLRHEPPVTLLPQAPEWLQTPVGVDFTATIGDDYARQVWDAANTLNDVVGCTVATTTGQDARIHFITALDRDPCGGAKPAPTTAIASTYYCPDGSVDIVANRLGGIREAYLLFLHELAHAFGVPDGAGEVMNPAIFTQDWSAALDRPMPTLSAAAGRAVAQRYCRRGQ